MTKHRLMTQALLIGGLSTSALLGAPQDPANDRPEPAANMSELVAQMMKFDKDGDGKLAKAEITDARLVRLFNRADADKNGTVTKGELEAIEAKEQTNTRNSFGGPGGPMGGPGGFGGPMGGRPKPGEVLPAMLRNRLKLTADQQVQLDELQRDVDARMAKILTDSQKAQIKQMSARGPDGPSPGGGRPGPGGPGGTPGNDGFPPPPA